MQTVTMLREAGADVNAVKLRRFRFVVFLS
jgi:hypothetical protein